MTSTSTTKPKTKQQRKTEERAKRIVTVLLMVFIRALLVWWLLPIVNDGWDLNYGQALALVLAVDMLIWIPRGKR